MRHRMSFNDGKRCHCAEAPPYPGYQAQPSGMKFLKPLWTSNIKAALCNLTGTLRSTWSTWSTHATNDVPGKAIPIHEIRHLRSSILSMCCHEMIWNVSWFPYVFIKSIQVSNKKNPKPAVSNKKNPNQLIDYNPCFWCFTKSPNFDSTQGYPLPLEPPSTGGPWWAWLLGGLGAGTSRFTL